MIRINELNREFFDCTNVKFDIKLDKKKIIISLTESRGHHCVLHFEDVSKYDFSYGTDPAAHEALNFIQAVDKIELKDNFFHFLINIGFGSEMHIFCKSFNYEIDE